MAGSTSVKSPLDGQEKSPPSILGEWPKPKEEKRTSGGEARERGQARLLAGLGAQKRRNSVGSLGFPTLREFVVGESIDELASTRRTDSSCQRPEPIHRRQQRRTLVSIA